MRGIERSYNGMEWIGRTWRVKIGSFEPRLLEKPPVVPRAMSYREPVIFTTFDLERRVTGVLTRLIDPTTDRIYLYRRPVLKRARFN